MTNIWIIYFLTACWFFKEAFSLELTKVVIPAYKFHGEMALLECQYELKSSKNTNRNNNNNKYNHNRFNNNKDFGYRSLHSIQDDNFGIDQLPGSSNNGGSGYSNGGGNSYEDEETLYSVKWYKDNEEFYRYVPKANPPQQSYRVDGIRVEHQSSNDVKVLLKRLTLKSSGLYRCEVSAEAPSFSSAEAEGRMEIVYLPRDGPHISGEQNQYEKGDTLNINCTSGKSHPSSTIQWFINDEPVYDSYVLPYPPVVHSHGLVTTILGLQMKLDSSHFDNGSIRVKCLTSVSPVIPMHSSSSDGSAAEARESGLNVYGNRKNNFPRKPPLAESREAYILIRNTAIIHGAVSLQMVLSLVTLLILFEQFLA